MSGSGFQANVDRFVQAARAYCEWVEVPARTQGASEVATASRLIAELYAAALSLPGVHEEYIPGFDELPPRDGAAATELHDRFAAFPLQYYATVFDPLKIPPDDDEPVCGDLLDDIGDIYADVKIGLLALERHGEPAAVWLWRTAFGMHWGRHAAAALAALHGYDPDDG